MMKCPNCTTAIAPNPAFKVVDFDEDAEQGWACRTTDCTACQQFILEIGWVRYDYDEMWRRSLVWEEGSERLVYPGLRKRVLINDAVPESIKTDYYEAVGVLNISPKASGALSRRILQAILSDQNYKGGQLDQQIQAVLREKCPAKVLPTALQESVKAVQKFGNASAHQWVHKETAEIITIEPDEAEFCLTVVEQLFQHYYPDESSHAHHSEMIKAAADKLKQRKKI